MPQDLIKGQRPFRVREEDTGGLHRRMAEQHLDLL
jgi:hypothetical protein